MISLFSSSRWMLFALLASVSAAASTQPRGTVRTDMLHSAILQDNRVGLDTQRMVKVYLPPGYADSGKAYPVVYFCHSLNWSPAKMFEDGNFVRLLERGFADHVVPEFILVAADCSTTGLGTLYENSPTSGRWRDFITEEVVPFIDGKFRTIRARDGRGLAGDFMGGRGALELAMRRSDLFGSVYALHPVATGTGMLPATYLDVDWKKIHAAKSVTELGGAGRSQIFALICQAFLPNPNRPPLYCDFPMELQGGELRLNPENNRRLQKGFLLEESIDEYAANLRSLRGIAFDWGRYDPTPAHVFANEVFSRKLDDLGIEHEAEEYRGNPWDKNWTPDGRFYTRLLPFFAQHLAFE
jgi:hypothetical protein